LGVDGASGTVAESISAYDKEVSDDLYGSGARYVSKGRLEAMLDSEWAQLINQLNQVVDRTLASFPLLIPSLPSITPEQTSLTGGSACGSNWSPAAKPTT